MGRKFGDYTLATCSISDARHHQRLRSPQHFSHLVQPDDVKTPAQPLRSMVCRPPCGCRGRSTGPTRMGRSTASAPGVTDSSSGYDAASATGAISPFREARRTASSLCVQAGGAQRRLPPRRGTHGGGSLPPVDWRRDGGGFSDAVWGGAKQVPTSPTWATRSTADESAGTVSIRMTARAQGYRPGHRFRITRGIGMPAL